MRVELPQLIGVPKASPETNGCDTIRSTYLLRSGQVNVALAPTNTDERKFLLTSSEGVTLEMNGLTSRLLSSGVSLGTANTFAYLMLAVVGVFLVSSALIAYIFLRKNRRENPRPPASPV
jgi:hypothetical protein